MLSSKCGLFLSVCTLNCNSSSFDPPQPGRRMRHFYLGISWRILPVCFSEISARISANFTEILVWSFFFSEITPEVFQSTFPCNYFQSIGIIRSLFSYLVRHWSSSSLRENFKKSFCPGISQENIKECFPEIKKKHQFFLTFLLHCVGTNSLTNAKREVSDSIRQSSGEFLENFIQELFQEFFE